MSTKEEFKAKARDARDTGQLVLRWPTLVRLAEYVIRALLGAVLAGAEIFEGIAPFGLGMTAASGTGAGGFFALVGTCFGYMAFRGFVDGLPYVAACILTFSVGFAFGDVKLCQKGWFMPVMAALLGGVTGFVHQSDGLTETAQCVIFGAELLLIAASAYFYRIALSPWEGKREEREMTGQQAVSGCILGCTLLISLAEVRFLEEISLGCIIGAVICMLGAWKGGVGTGAVAGVCVGLSMDLALQQVPGYAMAYAFAGVLTGVFRNQGKLFAALAYVLANGVVVLWGWEEGPYLSILYEVFIASVVFLVLPEKAGRWTEALLNRDQKSAACGEGRAHTYAREQLEYTADAFRELYDGLRVSFRRVAPNDADASGIFHRAAGRVCAQCALRDHCWQREYAATMNALNDGLPAMVKRGRGQGEDFPIHFRSRCLNFSALLAAANEELTALRYRRQFQSRAREGREAVCRQYGLFTRTLDGVLRKMNERQVQDVRREKKIRQHLAALGVEGEASVWYDPAGHLLLEVTGSGLDKLKKEEEQLRLARLMGVSLCQPEERKLEESVQLRWRQAEPLMAVAGVSAKMKEGQTVSGDAGAWFKTEDGGLHVLICDGMGSGPQARRESTLAVRLLEKFLRAGMEPEEALNTLNSALALRDEEEGGFSTVDLFRLDLYTGEAGFYKLGAAPTYVRHKGTVSRISGSALPAGLNGAESGVDVSKMRLEPGDSVVMVSDGVAPAQEDGWIKAALARYDGKDPKSLAAALIEGSAGHEGMTDDRTAVVLTIKER